MPCHLQLFKFDMLLTNCASKNVHVITSIVKYVMYVPSSTQSFLLCDAAPTSRTGFWSGIKQQWEWLFTPWTRRCSWRTHTITIVAFIIFISSSYALTILMTEIKNIESYRADEVLVRIRPMTSAWLQSFYRDQELPTSDRDCFHSLTYYFSFKR